MCVLALEQNSLSFLSWSFNIKQLMATEGLQKYLRNNKPRSSKTVCMTWQIGCWISELFGLHLLSVFRAAGSHLTCYMSRALDFVTPILTERAMSWLWGLVEMWWSHASPTHSQLSNSCKVSGSRIWWDVQRFPTLRAREPESVILLYMWAAAWQKGNCCSVQQAAAAAAAYEVWQQQWMDAGMAGFCIKHESRQR